MRDNAKRSTRRLAWTMLIAAIAVLCVFEVRRAIHSPETHALTLVSTGPPPDCGTIDDQKSRMPPDWGTFTPPEKGHSYTDPTFGCTVVRLTDAAQDGVAEHHYYATLSPMSADDSKLLINDEHGGWHVVDLHGNLIVSTKDMPQGNAGTLLWDASDGNTFYFTKLNSLMKGTVNGHGVKSSLVHTFTEYQIVLLPDKTDLSVDGQSFAMWGGHTASVGPLDIFTYNMRSNAKRTPYVTGCSQNVSYIQGTCVHGITQTADDNVIIDFANDGTCKECGNRRWDGAMLSHVQDATNHIDTGYDLSGDSIFIGMGNRRTLAGMRNPCRSGWGLDVRELNDLSKAECLLDKQPGWHVSYRGGPSQPWAALSFFDDRKPGAEFFQNNQNFREPSQGDWQLYQDEIILARIDGQAIIRLAHARSRSEEGFWAEPRAAISRDGRYVIFDSNMAYAKDGCPAGIENCSDVYLIKAR